MQVALQPPSAVPGAQVRWGIGDAVLAFVVGLVVSLIAAAIVLDPDNPHDPTTLAVLICSQNFAIIGWLALVARRKGTGSMRTDFGLTLRRSPAAWFADLPYFFLGIGLQLVSLLPIAVLEALYGHTAKQDVVNTADKASSWQIPVLALAIVLLAPLTEELLFRGTLLRSLLRRTTPETAVFVAAVAFGLVHALGDPSVGTLIALPAITLLGVVSGYQAVRTGNLSRSILLHMGFNALSVVFLFTV
jgi:membrane protease YdiL (CAAX protease family)